MTVKSLWVTVVNIDAYSRTRKVAAAKEIEPSGSRLIIKPPMILQLIDLYLHVQKYT